MALPTLDSVFASAADLPRRQMLAKWLVEELDSGSIADYWTLPERYLWAKIAVAAGAPKDEAAYIGLPKQYAWKDIYNAVSGSSLGTIDWSEKQALGHIAAAYRGDTGNPANLATYINWPWRYQVASIITELATEEEPEPETFNAVIVSGSSYDIINGTYIEDGIVNGKNKYSKDSDNYIFWYADDEIASWNIQNDGPPEFIGGIYDAPEDVEFPWEVETWTDAYNFGAPTLTPTNV
jgi:hypothetical protein